VLSDVTKRAEAYIPDATTVALNREYLANLIEPASNFIREIFGQTQVPLETVKEIEETQRTIDQDNAENANNKLTKELNNIQNTLELVPKNTATSLTPLFNNMNNQVINLIQTQSSANNATPNSFNINYGLDLLPILIGSLE
jgi:phosphoenolpyruvate carboxylase